MRRLKTVRRPPIYPKTPGHLPCSSLTHPLPLSSRRPSVSFGGFGLRRKKGSCQGNMTNDDYGQVIIEDGKGTPFHQIPWHPKEGLQQ